MFMDVYDTMTYVEIAHKNPLLCAIFLAYLIRVTYNCIDLFVQMKRHSGV